MKLYPAFISRLVLLTCCYLSYIFLLAVACSGPGAESDPRKEALDSLYGRAADSMEQNPAYARGVLQRAIELSTDSMDYYRIYSGLLQTYIRVNNYDTGYVMAKRLIRFCDSQESSKLLNSLRTEGFNYLGICHGQMHHVDSAIYYYRLAVQHVLHSDKPSRMPDIYINLADIYLQRADYVNGVYCYRRALAVSDSMGIMHTQRFPVYFGLGQAYFGLGDYDLADTYFSSAEQELEGRTLTEKFTFCNNRGNYYYYKGDYSAALPWFQRARALVLPGGYQFHINLCEGNLGDIHCKLNQFDSAHYYLDRSYTYFKSINHYVFMYYIATVNAELALKQGNSDLAHRWLQRYSSHQGVDPQIVSLRNKFLQEYYHTTGNYAMAYRFLQQNNQIADSVSSERVRGRVAELDMRYKQDTALFRKNMLIQEQQSDLEYLRLAKIFWISVFCVFVGAALFIYMYLRKKNDLLRLKHLNQVSKLRMESLRNRVSPHFIFNVLNHEVIAEDNGASRMELRGLVKLLRHSLEVTETLCVPLAKELDFVRTYIGIEQGSLGDGFILKWEIDTNVDCQSIMLPSMIIQIPVENAIKHALRGKDGEKILHIAVANRNGGIFVLVADNGRGYMQTPPDRKGTGTGLKVIYQTIELLNARNKNKIEFSVSTDNGTRVEMYIPRDYSYEL